LIDEEWDTPIGEASACGGDALIRIDAVLQVGGYNPSLCWQNPICVFECVERVGGSAAW
jgi:hypothetical protein